jgi:hypothetical protein
MRLFATSVLLLGVTALAAVAEWSRARKQRNRTLEAARLWRETPPAERIPALRRALDESPDSPPLHYLLGAALLREADYVLAARHFGMAYHGDADAASAALLTFACLKTGATEDAFDESLSIHVTQAGEPNHSFSEPMENRLAFHVVRTWEEMKSPALGTAAMERVLWSVLAKDDNPPPGISPLGRMLWMLAGPADCRILRRVDAESPSWARPLLEKESPAG